MATTQLIRDIEHLSAEDRAAVLDAIRVCCLVIRGEPVPAWFAEPPARDNSDLKRLLRGMDLLEPIVTQLVATGA